jgi:hypothetical protein
LHCSIVIPNQRVAVKLVRLRIMAMNSNPIWIEKKAGIYKIPVTRHSQPRTRENDRILRIAHTLLSIQLQMPVNVADVQYIILFLNYSIENCVSLPKTSFDRISLCLGEYLAEDRDAKIRRNPCGGIEEGAMKGRLQGYTSIIILELRPFGREPKKGKQAARRS